MQESYDGSETQKKILSFSKKDDGAWVDFIQLLAPIAQRSKTAERNVFFMKSWEGGIQVATIDINTDTGKSFCQEKEERILALTREEPTIPESVPYQGTSFTRYDFYNKKSELTKRVNLLCIPSADQHDLSCENLPRHLAAMRSVIEGNIAHNVGPSSSPMLRIEQEVRNALKCDREASQAWSLPLLAGTALAGFALIRPGIFRNVVRKIFPGNPPNVKRPTPVQSNQSKPSGAPRALQTRQTSPDKEVFSDPPSQFFDKKDARRFGAGYFLLTKNPQELKFHVDGSSEERDHAGYMVNKQLLEKKLQARNRDSFFKDCQLGPGYIVYNCNKMSAQIEGDRITNIITLAGNPREQQSHEEQKKEGSKNLARR